MTGLGKAELDRYRLANQQPGERRVMEWAVEPMVYNRRTEMFSTRPTVSERVRIRATGRQASPRNLRKRPPPGCLALYFCHIRSPQPTRPAEREHSQVTLYARWNTFYLRAK